MIRLGIIGTGVMGSNHARVASNINEFKLVGVVDPRKDVCEQTAARFDCAPYATPEEILNDVDAVVIASPTASHAELIKYFSSNDCHVLVEKPVCEDEVQLLGFTSKSQVMVGHIERFNPAVKFAKTLNVENFVSFSARREGPYSPRIVEGVTRDLMIHDIDLAQYILGSKLQLKGAAGATVKSSSEDVSNAVLSSANGCAISLSASRVAQTKIRDIRITTPEMLIYLDLLQRTVSLYRQSSSQFVDDAGLMYRESLTTETPLILQSDEPLAAELKCFAASISHGTASDEACSVDQGLAALDIANQITNLVS